MAPATEKGKAKGTVTVAEFKIIQIKMPPPGSQRERDLLYGKYRHEPITIFPKDRNTTDRRGSWAIREQPVPPPPAPQPPPEPRADTAGPQRFEQGFKLSGNEALGFGPGSRSS